jgi:hypothetical protein
MDTAYAPGRNELSEGGDEVSGIPERGILLEVRIAVSVVEDLRAGAVVGQFLQGQGARATY